MGRGDTAPLRVLRGLQPAEDTLKRAAGRVCFVYETMKGGQGVSKQKAPKHGGWPEERASCRLHRKNRWQAAALPKGCLVEGGKDKISGVILKRCLLFMPSA